MISILNKLTIWLAFLVLPISTTEYFGDKFTIIKWAIVYLIFFLETLWLISSDKFCFIKNKQFLIASALALLSASVALLKNYSLISLFGGFDFFIFWALFYIYLVKSRNKAVSIFQSQWPIYLGVTVVLGYAVVQFSGFARGSSVNEGYASTFGNNNMVSEYILMLMPMLLFFLKHEKRQKIYLVKAAIIIASVCFLILWSSRSAALSLCLVLVIFFVLKQVGRKEILTLVVALSFACVGKFYVLPEAVSSQTAASKAASKEERMGLIATGLSMIVNNPLGLGGTQFLFNSLPYQKFNQWSNGESVVYKSPHNEILRIAIEYGWLALISMLLFFGYLVRKLYLFKNDRTRGAVYAAYFVVFIIQALFQFPSENAFPFLFLALIASQFISDTEIRIDSIECIGVWARGAKVLLSSFAILFLSFFTVSNFLEFKESQSAEKSQLACELYPLNWRACLNKVQADISNHDLVAAKQSLAKELSQRPFNFAALKLLTITNFESGNIKNGCEVGWLFDELFNQRSSWSELLKQKCPAPQLESWTNAEDYRENYLKRLEVIIKN